MQTHNRQTEFEYIRFKTNIMFQLYYCNSDGNKNSVF